jgi:hypothetical protein
VDNESLKVLIPLHCSIFGAVIETAIDDKTLYEESALEVTSLKHELANLKRLVFGSKNERFIPAESTASQLSLDMQAEAVAACSLKKRRRLSTPATPLRLPKNIPAAPNFLDTWSVGK